MTENNYVVTITRTIRTKIRVRAKGLRQAHEQIHAYGPIEAVSDYPVIDETVDTKLTTVIEQIE